MYHFFGELSNFNLIKVNLDTLGKSQSKLSIFLYFPAFRLLPFFFELHDVWLTIERTNAIEGITGLEIEMSVPTPSQTAGVTPTPIRAC